MGSEIRGKRLTDKEHFQMLFMEQIRAEQRVDEAIKAISEIEFENGSTIKSLTSSKCKRSSRIKNMFPSFPNYTEEMYEGNEPSGSWEMSIGKTMYRWTTQWGDGQSTDDGIFEAKFQINSKVTIYIVGGHLNIIDIRYAGKPDIWEYSNTEQRYFRSFAHELEPDKIEKILNTQIPNCKFWDLVQARAKELYMKKGV